jgi:uncharacterized protein (DUF2336 family)
MVERLSDEDVLRLLGDPAEEARVRTASRLGRHVATASLSEVERAAAQQVLRAMMQDAAHRVRVTLAETLKDSPFLPHDVAMALARDVEDVALPVLQSSGVLGDADLVEIIEAGASCKQIAIAGRGAVSPLVAEALVKTDNDMAVATLVRNTGAALDASLLDTVYARFGSSAAVLEPLGRRPGIPVALAERLVAMTADKLHEYLLRRTDVPEAVVTQLVLRTREQATVELRSPHFPAEEAVALVHQIADAKRLTPSLILRALCLGDLGFVEAALAELAHVPLHNARRLIHDSGVLGYKSIYERANLPPAYFPAFKVGMDVARETTLDGLDNDRERYRRQMIERILTQFEDLGADDLDYLLVRLATPTAA